MALGDLSTDQSRFVDLVVQKTGLDRNAVVSWVGTESGWGITKGDHNYLNIGPGFRFNSVDQSANRVAGLINDSSLYKGVKSSVSGGAAAQIDAIGASPWGTHASTLGDVFKDLLKKGGSAAGEAKDLLEDPSGYAADKAGDVAENVARAIGLDKVVLKAGEMSLALVFTVGGLALVGLGLARITATNARAGLETAGSAVDKVSAVADFIPQGRAVGSVLKGSKAATTAAKAAV